MNPARATIPNQGDSPPVHKLGAGLNLVEFRLNNATLNLRRMPFQAEPTRYTGAVT